MPSWWWWLGRVQKGEKGQRLIAQDTRRGRRGGEVSAQVMRVRQAAWSPGVPGVVGGGEFLRAPARGRLEASCYHLCSGTEDRGKGKNR